MKRPTHLRSSCWTRSCHFSTYEEYQQKEEKPAATRKEDELLIIGMQLSDVLSRLSIEPSLELDETFQALLKRKKSLES